MPPIPCPKCAGALAVVKETFSAFETAESVRHHRDDWWESEYAKYIFSADLLCANSLCKLLIKCGGDGFIEETMGIDDEYGYFPQFESVFEPVFFHPPLKLFSYPEKTPDEVKNELKKSFAAFFHDPGAAANHVRSALEMLLTSLGVPQYAVVTRKPPETGKKRVRLVLHSRIEKVPPKHKIFNDLLMAIKILGNAGSHSSGLSRDDVLDLYEITEHVLESIFDEKAKRVAALAKKITKAKRPRKK